MGYRHAQKPGGGGVVYRWNKTQNLFARQGERMCEGGNFTICPDGSSGSIALEEAMAGELCRIFEVFVKKQQCYGPGNIAIFGERGVVVRSSDKLQRLINLVWDGNPNAISEETIDDTWSDLATYALIALLVRKNLWPEWIPSWKKEEQRERSEQ